MDFSTLGSVAAITAIAFLVGLAVKRSPLDDKWIPVIVGSVGGVLGVVGMFTISDFPAHDVLTAIAVGIVSGLAATGGHQIYKQLSDAGPDTSLTWYQYQADKGKITFPANEEGTRNDTD